MDSPFSNLDSLRIGSVDYVSPDEIKAMLDIEAPNDVALNTGVPRLFPRINNYVLIPNDNGFLVAQIVWITIENSQYPKRKGIQDFGIVDLPYPLRKMSLNPLGVLMTVIEPQTSNIRYNFSRGIDVFPTVGDPVLLPTEQQLKSIIESGGNRRVDIGICPMAGNAVVSIDPNRLFSRHLAVLGNTGSGKSCSVAGLIRWSIEAAQKKADNNPRPHIIILDPNGEYSAAFQDLPGFRAYGVEEDEANQIRQLKVPIWLWNSSEWATVVQASSGAQRPTLIQALRTVRSGQINVPDMSVQGTRNYLRTIVSTISLEIKNGTPWGTYPKPKGFNTKIEKWREGLGQKSDYTDQQNKSLNDLTSFICSLNNDRMGKYADFNFTRSEADKLLQLAKQTFDAFGGSEKDDMAIDEDSPMQFTGEDFLKCIEATAELMDTTSYVETMLIRIRSLLNDSKLKKVIEDDDQVSLESWLNEYICPSDSDSGSVTVIDLSLMPEELTHIVTSVIARVTLEALQRYRKINQGVTLPTVLVMEEAHTFIKRYNDSDGIESASKTCTKIFEKIAREGRKFGLGLILSSQRPSELSPTVLSQCNSFLLHRISNDKDQELVDRLVPDNLRGLLRELPSLPARNAVLLGWASEIPVMIQMNYLKKEYRPRSDDPDFWNSWTEKEQEINWSKVVDDWKGAEKK